MSTGDKNKRRPELDRLQQWMQAVITHPRGIRSELVSEGALRSLDADISLLEEIVLPSAKLSGAERLGSNGKASDESGVPSLSSSESQASPWASPSAFC